MKNPFVTNGYAGPEYFCDRVEETQHITEMLTNEKLRLMRYSLISTKPTSHVLLPSTSFNKSTTMPTIALRLCSAPISSDAPMLTSSSRVLTAI